jgi:N4-gp56 family major capsid protein
MASVSTGTPGAAAPGAGNFPADHKFYLKKFEETLQPELRYDMFGDREGIPSNESNTIVAKKMTEFSTLESNPLTEGVTPAELTALSMTRSEVSINQFGAFLRTTDRLTEEGLNGVTLEFTKRLGWQGARTMNLVYRNALLGGTNYRRNAGAATIDALTSAGVSASDYAYMWNAFMLAHVRPLSGMTAGSQNIGTAPIADAYIGLYPVEAVPFLETLDDGNGNVYENVEKYQGQIQTYPGEVGRYRYFRFIADTEAAIVVNAAGTPQNVARGLIFGKGIENKPYKIVDLDGGNMQLITKELGSSGTLDPLNQRASMGWKCKGGLFITQDLYMFRHEFSIGDA